jgi:hypothetical protein
MRELKLLKKMLMKVSLKLLKHNKNNLRKSQLELLK